MQMQITVSKKLLAINMRLNDSLFLEVSASEAVPEDVRTFVCNPNDDYEVHLCKIHCTLQKFKYGRCQKYKDEYTCQCFN